MQIAFYVAAALCVASIGYLLVACFCVLKFRTVLTSPSAKLAEHPGVTHYKPLHGLDFELRENLRSFMQQDYPLFQVVFGVSRHDDPAISAVRDLMTEFPDIDAELVVNERVNGENPKVSNLMNMDMVAKHELLIISDSDMIVEPDYTKRIVSSFREDKTGLVTCLYKGTPAPGLASHLGAMFISQWFTPSALIPATFGAVRNCFGATMAIKRPLLKKIGGLEALVGNLADDYRLGNLVLEAGYQIELAPVVVENIVEEKSLKSLVLHELRWARTIRSVEPLGFVSTFLTDAIPLALITGLLAFLADLTPIAIYLPLVLAFSARILLHCSTICTFSSKHPVSFWIIPIRDILSFFVRLLCYTGRKVSWRNSELSVDKGGEIAKFGPTAR